MLYLIDTNVFLHTIPNNILDVAIACKKKDSCMIITETILSEIDPYKKSETYETVDKLTHGHMSGLEYIKIFDISKDTEVQETLKLIRNSFYYWIDKPEFWQKQVELGTIKKEDVRKEMKRAKKIDLGECELVAIIKCHKSEYSIVSNDYGNVHLHPHYNIFEAYKNDIGLVHSGPSWLKIIGI